MSSASELHGAAPARRTRAGSKPATSWGTRRKSGRGTRSSKEHAGTKTREQALLREGLRTSEAAVAEERKAAARQGAQCIRKERKPVVQRPRESEREREYVSGTSLSRRTCGKCAVPPCCTRSRCIISSTPLGLSRAGAVNDMERRGERRRSRRWERGRSSAGRRRRTGRRWGCTGACKGRTRCRRDLPRGEGAPSGGGSGQGANAPSSR